MPLNMLRGWYFLVVLFGTSFMNEWLTTGKIEKAHATEFGAIS